MSIPRLFKSCNSGVALIEFALALPLLLTMLIGTIEMTRFTIINQKLDKVANAMADFATQGVYIGVGNLDAFVQAVPEIMKPFTFNGTIIFSSATTYLTKTAPCPAAIPCIVWQYKELGTNASKIGVVGANPVNIGNYVIAQGQNIIVAEVYMNYTPLLGVSTNILSAFQAQTIYKIAIYKPRQGSLLQLGS